MLGYWVSVYQVRYISMTLTQESILLGITTMINVATTQTFVQSFKDSKHVFNVSLVVIKSWNNCAAFWFVSLKHKHICSIHSIFSVRTIRAYLIKCVYIEYCNTVWTGWSGVTLFKCIRNFLFKWLVKYYKGLIFKFILLFAMNNVTVRVIYQ